MAASRLHNILSTLIRVAFVCAVTGAASSQAQTAPLNGVYAPCRTYSATPAGHFSANRATRTGSGSSARYFARGSGTELVGSTLTLAETGRQFFEVRSSCPIPPGCSRSVLQPPSGLGMHCSFAVPNQGMREYDVHVPDNYTNLTSFPLVTEMHGGGGAATPPLTEVTSGWREVSDTHASPFIMVWPVGSSDTPSGAMGLEWQTCNYDVESPVCPAPGFPNDRNFLIEVVKKVVADLKIDRRRIYAVGLSSGAAMVHALACKYSQYFAAVAPMSTGIRIDDQERARDNFDLRTLCNPVRAVPQFYVHSPHDQISSYELGVESVAFWRNKLGCTTAETTTNSSEVDVFDLTDDANDLTFCRQTSCGASAAVSFCRVDGSSDILNATGHIVWYGDDFYFPFVQPLAPRLALWAWNFLRAYSLPAEPSWPPPTF